MARLIEFQADALIKGLDALRGAQLPYAGAQALKQLGWQLKQHHREWMASGGFDNPVPFTLSSPRYTPDGLELRFFISDDGAKGQSPATYLYPVTTEDGGSKQVYATRFAKALQKEGISRLHPIPYLGGRGVRINNYGNMQPSQYTQTLAGLKRNDGTYFSIPDDRSARPLRGKLKRGIYQRKGRSLFMLFGYVSTLPRVNAKYDFFGITDTFAKARLPKLLSDALDRALR